MENNMFTFRFVNGKINKQYYENEGNDDEIKKKEKEAAEARKKEEEERSRNKTFTQDDLNRILAEEKKRYQTQNQKLIEQLEDLKKNANLTSQEKSTLQQRIEELQAQNLTKEQQLERERSKLQTEYQGQLNQVKHEAESWRNRYNEETILRSITDASSDAYNVEQVIYLLKPNTRLVEDIGVDGKGLGTFTPRVKFHDTDAEGKPTVLDLTVKEAIKRMKELPERYGNLFKSNLTGGLGSNGSVGTTGKPDPTKISNLEDYKKVRPKFYKRR